MTALGIDIGGAQLKLSDGMTTRCTPFALWKHPEGLADRLRDVTAEFRCNPGQPWAITMTGELADCYATRADGVRSILSAVTQAAGGNHPVRVWQSGGEFVEPEVALELIPLVAAANWHALATWVGRANPTGQMLLIDLGSTTTDLIPIESGLPMPCGRTDLERLKSGELVYLGQRRTPIPCVVSHVEWAGGSVPLARELFATLLDVGLILGEIPEDEDDYQTANGRAATRKEAEQRLSRLVCGDMDCLTSEDVLAISQAIDLQRVQLLEEAILRIFDRMAADKLQVVLAGEGEAVIRRVWKRLPDRFHDLPVLSLAELLGPSHSRGACAYALSQLGGEKWEVWG